jgi:pimeloyl-ACP methyl ester carboxylesterase
MATYVLVPGYWLGAWAWDEVAAELRSAGHEVHAITLTGLAEKADLLTPEVNLDTHIADVAAAVEACSGPVVLVGHSGGAVPVTAVADRMPERIARLVYVDSGPLADGMSTHDFHDPETQQLMIERVKNEGDGWLIPLPEPDPVNFAGLTPEHLATFAERGTFEPLAVEMQPLSRPAVIPKVPSAMIACTIPLDQLKAMIAGGNPIFGLMADFDLYPLVTGHWPMFSEPKALATLLDRCA